MTKKQDPSPVVGALVFNQKGKVLVTTSHKWKGKYVMPGGHVEPGETLKKAVRREIKEETGLAIYDIQLIACYEYVYEPTFYKKRHFIMFDYVAKCKSYKVKLDTRELQEYKWVEPDVALKLPLEKYTKKTLEKYLGKK